MLSIILSLLALIIAYAFHFFRIKPKALLKFYEKQGANAILNKPPKSQPQKSLQDRIQRVKQIISLNPELKAFATKAPGTCILTLTNPELVKIFLQNQQYYSKVNKKVELSVALNKYGLARTDGDIWKKHRKILSSAFHFEFFNSTIPHILSVSDNVLNFSNPKLEGIVMQGTPDFERITAEVIVRLFFGLSTKGYTVNGNDPIEELNSITEQIREYASKPVRMIFGDKLYYFSPRYNQLKKRIKVFREFFKQKITQRIAEIEKGNSHNSDPKRKDLLQILAQDRKEKGMDLSKTLSDDEIIDEFMSFFIAGKDTTSILITMMLYAIDKNPEWASKIRQEADILFENNKNIGVEHINKMEVLGAFTKEVLRFYHPAPGTIPRISNEDHEIGEFKVKKGTIISAFFTTSLFNPKFFKDPDCFNPGRFLEKGNSDEGWKHEPFAYLPFSAGPRNCIGQHMATIEAKLVVATVLKHFDMIIKEGYELEMGVGGPNLGYHPLKPIPFVLMPRKNK